MFQNFENYAHTPKWQKSQPVDGGRNLEEEEEAEPERPCQI